MFNHSIIIAKKCSFPPKNAGSPGGKAPWLPEKRMQGYKVIWKPKIIKNHNFSFLQVRIASHDLRNSIPITPQVDIWPKALF